MYCLAKISLFLMNDNNLKEFILKRSFIIITGNPKVALRIVMRNGQLQRKCTLSSGSKWHLGQISEVVLFILNKNEYRGALFDRLLVSLCRTAVEIFVRLDDDSVLWRETMSLCNLLVEGDVSSDTLLWAKDQLLILFLKHEYGMGVTCSTFSSLVASFARLSASSFPATPVWPLTQ